MNNIELLESLYKTAETDRQKEAIDSVCKAFYNAPFSVVRYFSDIDFDEIDGKVSSLIYERYCNWCNVNGYQVSSRKAVGTYIKTTYQMDSIQMSINEKREFVYRWVGYEMED